MCVSNNVERIDGTKNRDSVVVSLRSAMAEVRI